MIRDNLDYIHAHPEIYFTQEAKKGGYICPVCGNGSGSDGTGVKLIKGQSFRYKCFKCDTSGDVINFYAAEHHISNIEAIAQVSALYGLEVPKKKLKRIPHAHKHTSSNEKPLENSTNVETVAEDILLAASHLRETDYFIKRGISYETAEKYNCGYIADWIHPTKRGEKKISHSPRVIIPTSRESYVARSIDDNKIPKMKAGTGNIFNIDVLKSSRQNVVVVEGEFDALSIIEAGNDAIALGSTSNVDKLIDWLREKNIRPHLPLVLNLDADEAGQKATDKLAAALRDMRIRFCEVNLIVKGYKDQNESLVNFRDAFFQLVADIPHKVSHLQQQARFKLTDFAKIDTWEKNISTGRKAISTGWDSLDQALDGGLYEGLYVIPGTPGTGKTALALQMAFQIAQQKQDVLYISMEMGEEEIYERHISRISYQLFWHDEKNRHKAKTVHSMIQEGKTVTQARDVFKNVAPYLRTKCSVGTTDADDIRRIVEIYEYELNSLPVVFIDYLQILKAHDAHMTDKQAVDYNVLRLKQLSRDFKIPVVILSSMNRMSYSDVISMAALKESGAIEYTADVCLGLQHANMEQIKAGTSTGKAEKTIRQMKGKSERDMEIVVLKNRNGKIGEELSFSYYAMFHHFRCLSKEIHESNNANNLFGNMETTSNHTNWI